MSSKILLKALTLLTVLGLARGQNNILQNKDSQSIQQQQPSEILDLSSQQASLMAAGFNSSTTLVEDKQKQPHQIGGSQTSESSRQDGRASRRAGRMLDLELAAGDIGKEAKVARERSVSGDRQSRMIGSLGEEFSSTGSRQAKSNDRKKQMAISGFIPIISLADHHSKDAKQMAADILEGTGSGGHHSTDTDEQDSSEQTFGVVGNNQQLLAGFGSQTSIGHASFPTSSYDSSQASSPQRQWQSTSGNVDQDEAARSTRRLPLSGMAGAQSLLAGPRRLVSSLVGGQQVLQAPMNPSMASMWHQQQKQQHQQMLQIQQPESGCICVPFYQCRNGWLSESQVPQNLHHSPRAIPIDNQQSQQSLISSQQADQQPLVYAATTPNQNEIYEQLKKTIETENIHQLLQQQQQQYGTEERSKDANSGVHQNATLGEILGRSLLKPLIKRSGSSLMSGASKCGIMRTCCRFPNQVMASTNRRPMGRLTSGVSSHQMPPFSLASQLIQQQQQQQFSRPPLPLELASLGSSLDTNALQTHQHHHQQQPSHPQLSSNMQIQPAESSFMAGRCGLRTALGIAGRVQNSQPAAGSEVNAEFGEFPAHAAILKRLSPGDSLFVCSAVLVSNQWLATAAHCVRKLRPEELKVRLGEWDVARDDEFYPFVESHVRDIVFHPEFQSSSLANDLALLRLDTPLDGQQAPHIAPACLSTSIEASEGAGQRCWLAGWGKDAFGQAGAFQTVLRKVDLPLVSRQECELALRHNTRLGKSFRLHPSAMCAGGERGKDACEGDGGAGLFCTEPETGLTRAVGLVSWGIGCGQRGVPGVYTNLGHFRQWIEQVVASSGEEGIWGVQGQPLDSRAGSQNSNGLPNEIFKSIVNERSNSNSTNNENETEARHAPSSETSKSQKIELDKTKSSNTTESVTATNR